MFISHNCSSEIHHCFGLNQKSLVKICVTLNIFASLSFVSHSSFITFDRFVIHL